MMLLKYHMSGVLYKSCCEHNKTGFQRKEQIRVPGCAQKLKMHLHVWRQSQATEFFNQILETSHTLKSAVITE